MKKTKMTIMLLLVLATSFFAQSDGVVTPENSTNDNYVVNTLDYESTDAVPSQAPEPETESTPIDSIFKVLSIIFGAGMIVFGWLATLLGAKAKRAFSIIAVASDLVSSITHGFEDGNFTANEAQVVREHLAILKSVIKTGSPSLANLADVDTKISIIKSRHEK